MEINELNLANLITGVKTYPSWTTNRQYSLYTKKTDKGRILVYYTISGPVKRKIKRIFPNRIKLTPRFIWVLGFLKGEGANALGKSNYRRFTITNKNPVLLRIVLEELEAQNLFKRENIIKGGINIIHAGGKEKVIKQFWSEQLNVPFEKIRCYDDKSKTSKYGICHVFISDVLLRRAIDEISAYCIKR